MAGKEASITAVLGREPEREMGKRGHGGTGVTAAGAAVAAGAGWGADGGHGKARDDVERIDEEVNTAGAGAAP